MATQAQPSRPTQALAQALAQAQAQATQAVSQATQAQAQADQAQAQAQATQAQADQAQATQAQAQADQALAQAITADQAVTQALAAYVAASDQAQAQPRDLLTSQTVATQAQPRDLLTSQTVATQPAQLPENIRIWDARSESWRTVTVAAEPKRRVVRTRIRAQGRPRDLTGLSDVSPLPSWWRDTAYAPSDGLADLRSHVAPAAIKTRRPATVVRWGDAGSFAGPDETF